MFDSELNEDNLSDEYYDEAKLIRTHFNSKTRENITTSVKAGVLFLTDIVNNFRDVGMKYYGLDPVYSSALPKFDFTSYLPSLLMLC